MRLICAGCITHRQQHKSAAEPKDINLRGTDLCPRGAVLDGDFVTARERERWMWTRSPSQPRTHHQPSERLRCFPSSSFFFFFFPICYFSLLPLAKETSSHDLKGKGSPFLPGPYEHKEVSRSPTRTPTATHCLMLSGSVGVQYVPNFLLHQPSCNQLWITTVI